MTSLGDAAAVVFLIDKAGALLGIRPVPPRSENAFLITRSNNDHQFTVTARGPLRVMGIDLSESRTYPLTEVDGVWCADLSQPGTPVAARGDRKQAGQPSAE